MQYFTGTAEIEINQSAAVTLGKFDGMHLGHQILISKIMQKKEQGMIPTVFTFDMSPVTVVTGKKQSVLLTNQERRMYLQKLGIGCLIEYPFTLEVSHMPADVFIEEILVKRLKARYIAVGTDFHFGYQRTGDIALLEKMASVYGYELDVVHKRRDEKSGRIISSTFIREKLEEGKMEDVNALLGYPFALRGKVVNGNHLGSRIGFPTANILPESGKKLPPNGVYASRTWIDGIPYFSVTNIGKKPTVGEYPIGAETFIFEWMHELYGKEITVELYHQLREEKKFKDLEELKAQVERDKSAALEFLRNNKMVSGSKGQ